MNRIIHSKYNKYLFGVLLICILAFNGCESEYTKKFEASNSDYGSRDHASQNSTTRKMYGATEQGVNHHQNSKLSYSKELSNILSDLPGIHMAIVMVTDKNAYAALIYDQSATGIKGTGTPDESDHTGTTRGMYDTHTGNQSIDPNQIATGINSYYTEKNPDNLSNKLKQKVALELRKKNPQLSEVYITANREFINQMNVYYVESTRGVSLDKYVADFNKLVLDHFGNKE